MTALDEMNQKIIEEFRSHAGVVGGTFEGMKVVLVTHRGARSGIERTCPLVASVDGSDVVIAASLAGAPRHPDWYHNMVAHPDVVVEFGSETYSARAIDTTGDERDRLFAQHAAAMPFFHQYQEKAGERIIPMLRLVRA